MKEEFHPTKIFTHCPRCGKSDFSPNSERSNKCSYCDFVFYFNAASAVCALILNEKGQLLVTRRKHNPSEGMLDLPGGFVDLNESAEHALIRELKEELNLDIQIDKFLASFPNQYLFNEIIYFTCDLAFICKANFMNDIKPNDDVSECLFIDPKNLDLDLFAFDSIRRVMKEFLKNIDLSISPEIVN